MSRKSVFEEWRSPEIVRFAIPWILRLILSAFLTVKNSLFDGWRLNFRYWPNIRGNLNRPVLQKVPFCHKCARVVKGMNARWSVELISVYLMASFAPCKGIRILESRKVLLVESIWYPLNFYCEILNPGLWNVKYSPWNPESPFVVANHAVLTSFPYLTLQTNIVEFF